MPGFGGGRACGGVAGSAGGMGQRVGIEGVGPVWDEVAEAGVFAGPGVAEAGADVAGADEAEPAGAAGAAGAGVAMA